MKFPKCNDSRKCFSQGESTTRDKKGDTYKYCTILSYTYPDGKCPFCKRKRSD